MLSFSHRHVAARVRPSVQVRLEIELRGVHDAVLREEREVEQGRLGVEGNQRQRVVGLVVLQLHLLQETAFGAEGQPLQLVLDGEGLLRALRGVGKDAVFVAQGDGLLLRCGGRIHLGDGGRVRQLGQGCGLLLFQLAERVQGHLFHPGPMDGVLDALLLSQLLLRRGHEIHPAEEDGRDEDKSD